MSCAIITFTQVSTYQTLLFRAVNALMRGSDRVEQREHCMRWIATVCIGNWILDCYWI